MATRNRLVHGDQPGNDDLVTAMFLSRDESAVQDAREKREPPLPLFRRLLLNNWLGEILGIIFSLACFIALAIILYTYNGQRLPRMKYGLTLNAIVSILATGSKASLMFVVASAISQLKWCWFISDRPLRDLQSFDDASRGSLGSLGMVLSFKIKSLASVGAFITILALVFDPFVQQIVKYPIRMAPDPNAIATTVKASAFNIDPSSLQFLRAINAGIWSDASQFDLNPACPSGNCTWPDFQSLGWCSKCADTTSSVIMGSGCPNSHDFDGKCTLGFGQGDNVTVLDGIVSDTKVGYTAVRDIVWIVTDAASTTPDWLLNTTFPGIGRPLMVLGHVTTNVNASGQLDSTFNITRAEQCVLTPCLKDYNVSTAEAISVTNITATNFGVIQPYLLPRKFSRTYEYCWQVAPGNVTYVMMDDDCDYDGTIPCQKANTTQHAFCPVDAYQQASEDHLTGKDTTSFRVYGTTPDQSRTSTSNQTVPDAVQMVQATNLSYVLANVAASLTKLAFDMGNETVVGENLASEVYVLVDWEWLILPAILEIAGAVFLLLTALVSHRRGVPLWKTSILALLYHGLEERVLQEVRGDPAKDLAEIEQLSQNTMVKLGVSNEDSRVVLRKR